MATALLAPPPARAHLGHVVTAAERYLKIDVAGNEARVVVSLTLGPGEGRRVLAAADVSGDGRVDARERDAYLAEWARGLAEELPVFVDGARVEAAWGEGYLDPIGVVRPATVTVELVAHTPLAGGEQTIGIEDRMVRREVYDRTDVAFRAREGAELLLSGDSARPTALVPDLAYAGDLRAGEAITLAARVRSPARPRVSPWATALGFPWALGGAALLALLGGLAIWRHTRRPSQ